MAIGSYVRDIGQAAGNAVSVAHPWIGAGISAGSTGTGHLLDYLFGGNQAQAPTGSAAQDARSLATSSGAMATGQPSSWEQFWGVPGGFMQAPRYSPTQMQFLEQQILPLLQAQLGQQGQQIQNLNFGPIREEAQRRFAQETVPSLAERFTSLGGARDRTALSSSGFGRLVGSAGSQLQSQLGAMEQMFNQQNYGLQQNYLNMLLTAALQPQFETAYRQDTPGFAHSAGQAAGKVAPKIAEQGVKALMNWWSPQNPQAKA